MKDFMWKRKSVYLFVFFSYLFSFFLNQQTDLMKKKTMMEVLLIILQIYTYILTYKHTVYITPRSKDSYSQ